MARKRRSANGTEEILSRQKRHPHIDVTCDGSALDLESTCCENGALVRCPAGDGKLCSDGNAEGTLINKFEEGTLILEMNFSTDRDNYCTISLIIGVVQCDPSTSGWTYSENCCSSTNQCGLYQGGCNSNDQCSGQLECAADTSNLCGTSFSPSQKCCQYPGNYKISISTFSN